MSTPRILVAGIGNIFFGDDGFGVAVIAELAQRPRPEGVVLMDAGIRGIDLTYALMDDYGAAILIDAMSRGGAPGTLYVVEPTVPDGEPEGATLLDAHGLDPNRVLAVARASGKSIDTVRIVGCEPETFGSPEEPLVLLGKGGPPPRLASRPLPPPPSAGSLLGTGGLSPPRLASRPLPPPPSAGSLRSRSSASSFAELLSEPVRAAVFPAVKLVEELIASFASMTTARAAERSAHA